MTNDPRSSRPTRFPDEPDQPTAGCDDESHRSSALLRHGVAHHRRRSGHRHGGGDRPCPRGRRRRHLRRCPATSANTTNAQAEVAAGNMIVHTTANGAIASFTIGLPDRLARRGIRVNAVAPASAGPCPAERQAVRRTRRPRQRHRPAQLAGLFVLPAWAEGSYTTGAAILVTGGLP